MGQEGTPMRWWQKGHDVSLYWLARGCTRGSLVWGFRHDVVAFPLVVLGPLKPCTLVTRRLIVVVRRDRRWPGRQEMASSELLGLNWPA